MVRAYRFTAAVVAALVFVGSLGTGMASAQVDTGESYWGEHMINAIANSWPAVAIVLFLLFIAGAIAGFYTLDRSTIVLLLAASVYLAYRFYWVPAHRV